MSNKRPEDTDGKNSDNSAFSGFTAPTNAPGQDVSRASKNGLDVWLGEQTEQPAWRALYDQLLTETVEIEDANGKAKRRARWDWRRALYIAWRCVPPALRVPRYENELIHLLGLTNTRTIRQWREKDPGIEERIAALPREMLMDHVSAVMSALAQVASDPDSKSHPDRKLFLEMTGYYRPKGEMKLSGQVDVGSLSDEELQAIIEGEGSG